MSALNPPRPLTQLQFFLGDGCGVTCQYCLLSPRGNPGRVAPAHFPNGQAQYLPLEKMIQAIREALPLGLSKVRLSGGEPFLHPEFDALLDQLERLELGVTIETGGGGLTIRQATRLARLPQCRVIIGLGEGSTRVLDPRPNAPGDLQTASIAARRLAEAGLAAQVAFTLTRQSIQRVEMVIRLAELLGASALHFTGAQPERPQSTGADSHQPAALRTDILAVEELIAFGRKVERELARSTRLLLSIDLPPAFRGLHPMARIEGQGRCAICDGLIVLPGGEYALCGIAESVPEMVLGRVGVDALATIWYIHPVLVDLREGLPDRLEGICGRCIMKTACLGYCAAENYLRSGTFRGPNWFCQAAERAGLFPASRLIENQW